jgi:hypothetical protein
MRGQGRFINEGPTAQVTVTSMQSDVLDGGHKITPMHHDHLHADLRYFDQPVPAPSVWKARTARGSEVVSYTLCPLHPFRKQIPQCGPIRFAKNPISCLL